MFSAGSSERTVRVAVCLSCKDKALQRDKDTWMRIHTVVKERAGL
jgi:hypothetical protein